VTSAVPVLMAWSTYCCIWAGVYGPLISLTQLGGAGLEHLADQPRHEVEVIGQRPRCHGLEHVVVEHEVLGVGPVVRDLRRRVVAHDIGCRRVRTGRLSTVLAPHPFLPFAAWVMNPSIFPPCDVDARTTFVVRPASVDVGRVVVWRLAPACRHGHAHRRHAIRARNAVGTRIGAEVAVERAVLLLDDDDVLDLVDAGRTRSDPSTTAHPFGEAAAARRAAAGAERQRQHGDAARSDDVSGATSWRSHPSFHGCLPFD